LKRVAKPCNTVRRGSSARTTTVWKPSKPLLLVGLGETVRLMNLSPAWEASVGGPACIAVSASLRLVLVPAGAMAWSTALPPQAASDKEASRSPASSRTGFATPPEFRRKTTAVGLRAIQLRLPVEWSPSM
jgi:hypothetical protein